MSNEVYSMVGGKKVDAELHDEILGNEEADGNLRNDAVDRAIARGVSEATAIEMYNP